jgi:hypothetical protein
LKERAAEAGQKTSKWRGKMPKKRSMLNFSEESVAAGAQKARETGEQLSECGFGILGNSFREGMF